MVVVKHKGGAPLSVNRKRDSPAPVYLQSRFFTEPERTIAARICPHGRQRWTHNHNSRVPLRVRQYLTAAPSSSEKHGWTGRYSGRCVAGVRSWVHVTSCGEDRATTGGQTTPPADRIPYCSRLRHCDHFAQKLNIFCKYRR